MRGALPHPEDPGCPWPPSRDTAGFLCCSFSHSGVRQFCEPHGTQGDVALPVATSPSTSKERPASFFVLWAWSNCRSVSTCHSQGTSKTFSQPPLGYTMQQDPPPSPWSPAGLTAPVAGTPFPISMEPCTHALRCGSHWPGWLLGAPEDPDGPQEA